MYSFKEEIISKCKSLIGKKIIGLKIVKPYKNTIGTEYQLNSYEQGNKIYFEDFSVQLNFDWYESYKGHTNGYIYFDYGLICKNETLKNEDDNDTILCKIDKTISSITIYGREIPIELYTYFGLETSSMSNDLFVLTLSDGFELFIQLGDATPSVNFILSMSKVADTYIAENDDYKAIQVISS